MTRAERAARPSRAVAAKLRQDRIRALQREQHLCRVGSCTNRLYADEKSCVLHRKRAPYQCTRCDGIGHNALTCKDVTL